ncbi:4-oxalocrotonate tautomerase [Salicibibacter kimchii]|uniref:Tautomerase n=1 Tax=Salicibibacter kimchii TaxID=2099786 RepID=A0A345C1W8_9BACI|nr:4-oxalocrotonate tautomerase [Salicibibacter kimchii]AXF57199.1 4-oxalocrotonate tautomerase [Salicibibacter kimchii]
MPLINVQILEGREPEKIESLIENVSEAVSESLDAPKENVRVTVTEVPKTHWAVGGKSMKQLGR